MLRRIAVLAAVAIITVVAVAAPSTSIARKCAGSPMLFPDAPDHVWVLDGKMVDSANGQTKIAAMADVIQASR